MTYLVREACSAGCGRTLARRSDEDRDLCDVCLDVAEENRISILRGMEQGQKKGEQA